MEGSKCIISCDTYYIRYLPLSLETPAVPADPIFFLLSPFVVLVLTQERKIPSSFRGGIGRNEPGNYGFSLVEKKLWTCPCLSQSHLALVCKWPGLMLLIGSSWELGWWRLSLYTCEKLTNWNKYGLDSSYSRTFSLLASPIFKAPGIIPNLPFTLILSCNHPFYLWVYVYDHMFIFIASSLCVNSILSNTS